jgi:hypothetical protein
MIIQNEICYELTASTALVIMTSNFLQAHNHHEMKEVFHEDNKEVHNRCAVALANKLQDHQQPNHDLYLESQCCSIVKQHSGMGQKTPGPLTKNGKTYK